MLSVIHSRAQVSRACDYLVAKDHRRMSRISRQDPNLKRTNTNKIQNEDI